MSLATLQVKLGPEDVAGPSQQPGIDRGTWTQKGLAPRSDGPMAIHHPWWPHEGTNNKMDLDWFNWFINYNIKKPKTNIGSPKLMVLKNEFPIFKGMIFRFHGSFRFFCSLWHDVWSESGWKLFRPWDVFVHPYRLVRLEVEEIYQQQQRRIVSELHPPKTHIALARRRLPKRKLMFQPQ